VVQWQAAIMDTFLEVILVTDLVLVTALLVAALVLVVKFLLAKEPASVDPYQVE
jgi:hypothetical protein